MRNLPSALYVALLALSCAHTPAEPPEATASDALHLSDNPLLAEWTGPQGGVPAFDSMDLSALEAALEEGMAHHLAEIDAIAQNPVPPDFDNTIVAMEAAGRPLDRVRTYHGIWRSNLSSPEAREIQTRMAPKLAAHRTSITGNAPLFARIEAVFRSAELSARSPAEQRLAKLIYDRFARQGAALSGEERARYDAIQRRLAELQTAFSNNVLADEESRTLYLSQDQLGGLPPSFVAAAAEAADQRGHEGAYAITNTRSSMDPFLTHSAERALREQVWRSYYDRGDNGGEHDNNGIIAEILQLRHERSLLLGYESFAHWRLENRMAGDPQRAMALMEALWPAALARVERDVAAMQALADGEGADLRIEAWDYRHYAEKLRQQSYDLDATEVRQYLQLDKLRQAMFMVAGKLFGFGFSEVTDGSVPVYHPDVRVWEVRRQDSGGDVGLWYLDPFARQGKRSGAWASGYRGHTSFDDPRTVLASNNSNFIPGAPGEPVLLSWDDALTLFHEFGHALHYLSSEVAYPTLNSGVRDYTELQSQILERWLSTDEVFETYLLHCETGEPMPAELVERLRRAANFNEGFATTEYLASAIVDMKYHTADPAGLDPDEFERRTLQAMGMPPQIVMRHRSPHFGHIFSGESYAAGYYGYLWADVLAADAAEAFAEAPGGFYDAQLAARLVQIIFAPRNATDPAEAYRAFRGRDATVEALLREKGFLVQE